MKAARLQVEHDVEQARLRDTRCAVRPEDRSEPGLVREKSERPAEDDDSMVAQDPSGSMVARVTHPQPCVGLCNHQAIQTIPGGRPSERFRSPSEPLC